MQVKKIYDSTDTADEAFADINVGRNSAATLTYDLSGGGSAFSTTDIYFYGKLPAPNDTTDLSDYTTTSLVSSEWVEIAKVDNIVHDGNSTQGSLDFDHIYPQLAVAITGNARSARVRVYIGYNEQQ